jgi:hypothetical protein
MQFGNSLAQLATDIAAGHGARQLAASTRASTVSAIRAATLRTISANTAHRAVVMTGLTAAATALRRNLAADDAALGAAVKKFRAQTRDERAAAAKTLAASLDQFVAGVRTETAAIRARCRAS